MPAWEQMDDLDRQAYPGIGATGSRRTDGGLGGSRVRDGNVCHDDAPGGFNYHDQQQHVPRDPRADPPCTKVSEWPLPTEPGGGHLAQRGR